jgi:excisionase family DNA binding protein
MSEMLTAKDMQALLHVDRSTIYRMAESGRLPAIKVGRQWRFPADQVDSWFQMGITAPSPTAEVSSVSNGGTVTDLSGPADELAALLPLECVELIQNSFAELLGVMLVVTDMDGHPITRIGA